MENRRRKMQIIARARHSTAFPGGQPCLTGTDEGVLLQKRSISLNRFNDNHNSFARSSFLWCYDQLAKEGCPVIRMIKSFDKTKHSVDAAAGRFFFHHPYLGLLAAFIGIPSFILGAVAISTTAVALPLSVFVWMGLDFMPSLWR